MGCKNMVKDKVNYKEGRIANGIKVPNYFTTISDDDAYKILEALNIDWKKINIPWAQAITKWNSANIDPSQYQRFDAYRDKISSLEYNNINNMVDWLNNDYDYLSDSNTPLAKNPVELIPGWAKEGEITDSKDIIDILNYLIWRVVSLDFFTNFWDHRNATFPKWMFVLDWNGSTFDSKPTYEWNNKLNAYYILNNGDINVILEPTTSRIESINLLSGNSIYEYYVENNTPSNSLYLSIYSTSPIAIELMTPKVFEANTIDFKVGNYQGQGSGSSNENRILYNDEYYYRFKLQDSSLTIPSQVLGTSNYNEASVTNGSSWLYKIINNFNDYSGFDPRSYSIPIVLMQRGGSDSTNANVFTDLEKTITISINKTTEKDNKLTNLVFGDNQLISGADTNEATRVGNTDILKKYKVVKNSAIPYWKDGQDNEYKISFNISKGEEYGIYPYFFIDKLDNHHYTDDNAELTGKLILDSDNKFVKYTCKWGTIEYRSETQEYFYIPCEQYTEQDEIININVIFYYNKKDRIRQLSPLFYSFQVTLNKEVQNRIIFKLEGTNYAPAYRNGEYSIQYNYTGTEWGSVNEEMGDVVCNNNLVNNISYFVKTITYDDYINGAQDLIFDDFITTYCADQDKITVKYLGYINQDNSKCEINIDNQRITPNTSLSDINYNIYLNTNMKIGNSKNSLTINQLNKSFYYCPDNNDMYYPINAVILNDLNTEISINNGKGIIKESDLSNNYLTNGEIHTEGNNEASVFIERKTGKLNNITYRNRFGIKKSTATYPLENGIIKQNNVLYDADHEYFYLVFKLTCPEGVCKGLNNGKGISYKACMGYYFLKVLRKNEMPDLSINNFGPGEINYLDANDTPRSFRIMPKIPIYLNRLFDEASQEALKNYDGIFDWGIYGYHDKETASYELKDILLAIKDEREGQTEEYIKIFNEGDQYPIFNYNIDPAKINQFISFTPENGISIKLTSASKMTVGKFNTKEGTRTHSGAILFINKLLRANRNISDGLINNDNPYLPINGDNISLQLYFGIGNSSKYIRNRAKNQFLIDIYKRTYDFDLVYYGANNVLKSAIDTNGYIQNPATILLNRENTMSNYTLNTRGYDYYIENDLKSTIFNIFISSNEFGSGTSQSFEANDNLRLILDNNMPILNISNLDINESINVVIESDNTNKDRWLLNGGDSLDVDFTKNYNILSLSNYDSGIFIFGTNSTQTIEQFQIKFAGDKSGIYNDKKLTIYLSIQKKNS